MIFIQFSILFIWESLSTKFTVTTARIDETFAFFSNVNNNNNNAEILSLFHTAIITATIMRNCIFCFRSSLYHKKDQRLTREAMKSYLRERGDMVISFRINFQDICLKSFSRHLLKIIF
jgi:hypothetical protein